MGGVAGVSLAGGSLALPEEYALVTILAGQMGWGTSPLCTEARRRTGSKRVVCSGGIVVSCFRSRRA